MLSYEKKESSIPSLMTPCLSLPSLFCYVYTSYLFHILIQKEITLLEEECDEMKGFVGTNCVDEDAYRHFCLRYLTLRRLMSYIYI